MKLTAQLAFCFVMAVLCWPASGAPVDDIRILVDVSGSMAKTDPNNLRVPAVRMLNGLIPGGSKAGLWTFGRYVNMEVKWGRVDEQWRKNAEPGVSHIHSKGQFTNIDGALKRASGSWNESDPNTRRNIILLTDGKVDISKNPDTNQQSRKDLLQKTIPQLVRNGVKVHIIALSHFADEDLLKQIAVMTSGSFETAESARDLQRIFLHMFERAATPDTVPISDNSFNVDNSIREMTLLIFRKSDRQTIIKQPDGKQHTAKQHAANVRWQSDQGYDLITVSKPLAGKWMLEADVDPDNRVMIVTDLTLEVEGIPTYTTPDSDIDIHVELHSKGKKISKNSFLKFVDFSISHNVGDTHQKQLLQLKKSREIVDKGIYLYQLPAPLQEGSHEVMINAEARTFDRSKRFTIEVLWPIEVTLNKAESAGEYDLNIRARQEYIQPDSLQLEVVLVRPDDLQQPLIMNLEDKVWRTHVRATDLDGLHKLRIRMSATTNDGETIQHSLDELSLLGVVPDRLEQSTETIQTEQDTAQSEEDIDLPESSEEGPSLMTSIAIIAVFNLLLLLMGGGAWFYLRRQRNAVANIPALEESQLENKGDKDG
jgi:uncharacterized protein (TIGR03503 family)